MNKLNLRLVIIHSILIFIAVWFLFPYFYMTITSTMNNAEFLQNPPRLYPSNHILDNAAMLQENYKFIRVLWNTFFVSFVGTILATLVSTMSGYGFEKFDFPFKKNLFVIIFFTSLVPYFTTLIPMFILFSKFGLVNSYAALIIPGISTASNIFMMRQFMKDMPNELIEAARIDGLSEFQIFFKVVVPIMKPAIITMALLIFVGYWNLYLWPLVVINSDNMNMISLVIRNMSMAVDELQYGVRMLISTLATIPIIILYLVVQYNLKSSDIGSAIK